MIAPKDVATCPLGPDPQSEDFHTPHPPENKYISKKNYPKVVKNNQEHGKYLQTYSLTTTLSSLPLLLTQRCGGLTFKATH